MKTSNQCTNITKTNSTVKFTICGSANHSQWEIWNLLGPGLASAGREDDAYNESVQSQCLSENENKNHSNEKLWLLSICSTKDSYQQVKFNSLYTYNHMKYFAKLVLTDIICNWVSKSTDKMNAWITCHTNANNHNITMQNYSIYIQHKFTYLMCSFHMAYLEIDSTFG